MYKVLHWLNGQETSADNDRELPIMNPATGTQVGTVALASKETLDNAVADAKKAQQAWADLSISRRASVLFAFRQLVIDHTDELAEAIATEQGKTLSDARGEVARGLETVEYACGLGEISKGAYSFNASTAIDVFSFRQPLGVVAGITPFNFPAMVSMWMHPIALATGNAFILKPSERDPHASLLLAKLYQQAGLPDGLFQVANGDKEVVDAILANPDISAVSFVGSTPVARYIRQQGAAYGKRVQALGGANNHAVVMPDADMDFAAKQLASAAFGAAGQRCMAIAVAVTVGGAHEPFLAQVIEEARALKVGPAVEAPSDFGPVITAQSKQRILALVDEARQLGATVHLDGSDVTVDEAYKNGHFVSPVVVSGVTPDMKLYSEEVFGPVLAIVNVDTLDEAISLINGGPFGNGTSIFTSDGESSRRFVERIHVGMVGVNVPIPTPVGYHSFGGWKDSLYGEYGAHGPEAVRFYTRNKAVTQRWPLHETLIGSALDFGSRD